MKRITVEISLDGPRAITEDLPENWDTWEMGEQGKFIDEIKKELIMNSLNCYAYDPDEEIEP